MHKPIIKNLASLHQLQNVYFMLKGRELKLYKSDSCYRVIQSWSYLPLTYPGIILTYKILVSFIGTNGMEDFKLLPDLNFKATMKPVFFHFTQSIFITNGRLVIKSAVFGSYALNI
jgi:hypothetical protein